LLGELRALRVSTPEFRLIRDKAVQLRKNTHRWTQDFLHELKQFPTEKHDDQIDAVSVLHETMGKENCSWWRRVRRAQEMQRDWI